MIPRIPPPSLRFDELPPFATLKHEARPLSFVVDPTQLDDGEARDVLLAYAKDGGVRLYATSPVDGAADLELAQVPDGYVPRHQLEDVLSGKWSDEATVCSFAVMGLARRAAAAGERAQELGCSVAEARRNAVLITTTEQLQDCDGLVSDDAAVRSAGTTRSTIYSSGEAAALIGLQARVGGDFSLGPDMGPFGRFYFYWILARELLPAGWQWFSACHVASTHPDGDSDIFDIAGAAIHRLDRALRARDLFHAAAKQTPANSDDALFYFETTMLYLSAAFDVVARVANRVYRPTGSSTPSWRSTPWLQKLGERDAALAAFMQLGEPARDALEAVQLLRNTIHGEALSEIEHQAGGERRKLIQVPPSELGDLLTVIERRGGRARWGVEEHSRAYVDPQLYIEATIADAAPALDRLMAMTQVERLPGVDLATIKGAPPNVPSPAPRSWTDFDPFSFENRRRVRALGGFGEIPIADDEA
jgi:hypothetical protein